jgi:hypothetical protein
MNNTRGYTPEQCVASQTDRKFAFDAPALPVYIHTPTRRLSNRVYAARRQFKLLPRRRETKFGQGTPLEFRDRGNMRLVGPKPAICAFVIGIGLIVPVQAAKKEWKTVSAGPFALHTQGSESQGREFLKELLWFWKFIDQRFPGDDVDGNIILIDVPDGRALVDLRQGGQSVLYDGQDTVLLPNTRYIGSAKRELVKLKLKRCDLKIPYWLRAGLAQLFLASYAGENRVVLTLDYNPRGNGFFISIEKFFDATPESKWLRGDAKRQYRDVAARTAHMLLFSTEYRAGFEDFVQVLRMGAAEVEALNRVYAVSPKRLREDVRLYSGTYRSFPQPNWALPIVTETVRSSQADTKEIGRLLAGALRADGQVKAAEKAVRQFCPDTCN